MKIFIYTSAIFFIINLTLKIDVCEAQWQFSNGPYSGDGRCFLVTPSAVQAGTNGSGTLYSTDNGIHWYSSGNIGLTNQAVNCFIQTGANFFAGTNGGVFMSTNSGSSWFAVNTGLYNSTVKSFALSGTTLFAGTNGGVFQTTNNGALWVNTSYGLTNSNVNALCVLNGNLYAGTYGGGVFKSTDNGNSWTSSNFGLINQNINTLFISGSSIFAGTAAVSNTDGFYKTTNYGANWSPSGLQNLAVYSLISFAPNLYAGTIAGIYRSSNNGTNWSTVQGLAGNSVYALGISGGNILAGHSEGFAVSTNGGTLWENMGYLARDASDFARAGSYLYASNGSYGVYASSNNGNSWYSVNNGFPFLRIMCMTSNGSNVYAAYTNNNLTQNGIYYSTNNGAEWIYRWNSLSRHIISMNTRGSYFYAGLYYKNGATGLSISSDSGNYFADVYSLLNISVWDIEFTGTNDVYIAAGNIFRSTNNGINWTTVYTGGSTNDLAVMGNNIFAGTASYGAGVIMSSNNGQNWNTIGLTGYTINSMAVYQNNLIVSTQDSGFYLTNNLGATWHKKNQGIYFNPIYSTNLFISDNYIFTGLGNTGAWRRNISEIINVRNISSEIPPAHSLSQNYPNPFNPTTKISFQLSVAGNTSIKIFDITGKEIATLVNEKLVAGTYTVDWNASEFPSGVYFYKMTAGDFSETKRMLLVK